MNTRKEAEKIRDSIGKTKLNKELKKINNDIISLFHQWQNKVVDTRDHDTRSHLLFDRKREVLALISLANDDGNDRYKWQV